MCVYIYIYTCTYVCIYIYIYVYTHICFYHISITASMHPSGARGACAGGARALPFFRPLTATAVDKRLAFQIGHVGLPAHYDL